MAECLFEAREVDRAGSARAWCVTHARWAGECQDSYSLTDQVVALTKRVLELEKAVERMQRTIIPNN